MKPVYLIAEIFPHPAQLDVAAQAYRTLIEATRDEVGCLLYDLVVEDDDDRWIMLEKWESQEAWERHMSTDHVRHINEVSPGFSSSPTKLRFLSNVTVGVR